VSTELFPSNGCCTVACYLAVILHATMLFPSSGLKRKSSVERKSGATRAPRVVLASNPVWAPDHIVTYSRQWRVFFSGGSSFQEVSDLSIAKVGPCFLMKCPQTVFITITNRSSPVSAVCRAVVTRVTTSVAGRWLRGIPNVVHACRGPGVSCCYLRLRPKCSLK
jgi:hypothetical protein